MSPDSAQKNRVGGSHPLRGTWQLGTSRYEDTFTLCDSVAVLLLLTMPVVLCSCWVIWREPLDFSLDAPVDHGMEALPGKGTLEVLPGNNLLCLLLNVKHIGRHVNPKWLLTESSVDANSAKVAFWPKTVIDSLTYAQATQSLSRLHWHLKRDDQLCCNSDEVG